ncbi:MAG: radical SAM family heme chaperone HemW, partial [bacterium]
RHNLTYWRRFDYLGLGCAAHSMLDDCRFRNPDSLDEYLSGARMLDVQRLSERDIMEETVMLGTRTTQGTDRSLFDNCNLDRLLKAGLIELDERYLRLTRRGLELQNAVVLELLEVLGC